METPNLDRCIDWENGIELFPERYQKAQKELSSIKSENEELRKGIKSLIKDLKDVQVYSNGLNISGRVDIKKNLQSLLNKKGAQ